MGFPKNNIQFIKSQNLGKSWLFWPIPWNQIEASQLWASDWIKKTVILIFMKSVKKLYFYPDFFFLQIKCNFFITPTEFECLHFEISKSVYSKPLLTSIETCLNWHNAQPNQSHTFIMTQRLWCYFFKSHQLPEILIGLCAKCLYFKVVARII